MRYQPDPIRETLANKYITSGNGIEIGALCHPLRLLDGVRVDYIDRFDVDGLHKQYPPIPIDIMTPVTYIDNGETLSTFADSSQDFVIANHFLEHCEFPIETIINWLRVLTPEGIIFCAIPNGDVTFDRNREKTPLQHLIHEHVSRTSDKRQHYLDACGGNELLVDDEMFSGYSIHYHVWSPEGILEFFEYLTTMLPVKIEDHIYNAPREETIFVLRKL